MLAIPWKPFRPVMGTGPQVHLHAVPSHLRASQHPATHTHALLRCAGLSSREVKALLVKLLAREPWKELRSVIVYVAFQAAAEEAARYLRAQGVDCLCYHAGRPARVRPLAAGGAGTSSAVLSRPAAAPPCSSGPSCRQRA